ncbi:hypothetical protein [Micromonospora psammae]|uniref:hypothetical protein n=1 Tax=Micromonospora sp. CPCC 205556 TaxID=3122398 RepID=UPI002FF036E2
MPLCPLSYKGIGPPAELAGRSTYVAVRAYYVALLNLRLHRREGRDSADHLADTVQLIAANMVELQHHDVRFAAVHTRVGGQILNKKCAQLGPDPVVAVYSLADVSGAVVCVVPADVFPVTLLAVRIGVWLAALHRLVKLSQRQRLAAP